MKNNLVRIENLRPGETFEIPSVSETLRNGVFLFSTTTSSRVIVDVFENNIWKNKQREYISNSVNVIPTGKVELEKALDGTWQVAGTLGENGEIIKVKRGRKPKIQPVIEKESFLTEKEQKIKNKLFKVKVKTAKPPAQPYVKTGKPRGRAPSTFVPVFPKGKWLIADVAILNKVEKYTINNFMVKAMKEKTMNFEVVGEKRNEGARGKASKIYKVVK